jgi:hypothetical protein
MSYLVLGISHDGQRFIGVFSDQQVAKDVRDSCRKHDDYKYWDVDVYEYSLDTVFEIMNSKEAYL